ncbi:YihY/virulence factor BrkB family protein [Paenibacillus sp. TRM 82003]|uniref:YihY/virulence factor BrkB family protein n=1 Tax=Kineococcus sp. TRM81007 TaxID=2925831 RepID=UPI001F592F48|nr:YihY/virulence factor BrkB family protein [Kineococcus sp. TRM81007]MCI2238456.1 YihY/virulence factor BrkB family protein [Kineococcus sp. TRM81007]MCI3922030.1 YihY/virulence factor BrkB family protein [Paenibacillus sp. TRM 82003]
MLIDGDEVWRRVEGRAEVRRTRVRGRNPALVAVRAAHRAVEVRVPGLAAEIAYYLLVSLLPLVTMLGASLGLLRGFLGQQAVDRMEERITGAVEAALSPQLAGDVAVPFVEQLLREEQVGVALTSVAVALWLGSRVFRAAVRTLGDAYRVQERRGFLRLWALSLVFTLVAVVVTTAFLALAVVGPLLGGGQEIADALGAGSAFRSAWALVRWPVLAVAVTAFLAWLYQVGQNADTRWRDALPGAALATLGLVVLALGFRLYVDVAGPSTPDVEGGDAAVRAVGQFLGTALAAALLGWLAAVVVLLGGVFNAEWHAEHHAEQDVEQDAENDAERRA